MFAGGRRRLARSPYSKGPGPLIQAGPWLHCLVWLPDCQLRNGDDVAQAPPLLLLLRGARYFIK
jgi:hypothetical protein